MSTLGTVQTTPSAKAARQTVQQVASDFNTHVSNGLHTSEVVGLRSIYGWNELDKEEDDSMIIKFLKSFSENPLILLLLGSAVVSLLMGQMDDAISITMVSSTKEGYT
jgi:Ca2+-transporting ATPase